MKEKQQEKKYYYRAYGLNIVSDFIIPFFNKGSGDSEVTIRCCRLSDFQHEEMKIFRDSTCLTENDCGNVCSGIRYHVSRGHLICISVSFASLDQTEQVKILTEVFRYLFFQRGCVCLHASAVKTGGRVVAFTGKKGSGKSTLAAILSRKGSELLSDDSCIISTDNRGKPLIWPGVFTQNLSAESLQILHIDRKGLKTTKDRQKYITGVYPSKQEGPLPIDCIYYLCADNGEQTDISDVNGYEKTVLLMNNASNMHKIKKVWPKDMFFQKWSHVAAGVSLKKINRPLNSLSLPDSILDRIVQGGD